MIQNQQLTFPAGFIHAIVTLTSLRHAAVL